MLPSIDFNRVFARIPEIMHLELVLRGAAWEGQYYINGQKHAYKRDKLKVKLRRGIWVYEQGGESIPLVRWLVDYGGCADYKEAFSVLRGKDSPIPDFREEGTKPQEVKYVPRCDMEALMRYDLMKCPLFRYMSSLFGEERTRKVWRFYNVCTDSRGLAVYWYVDKEGRVLHDKKIKYSDNGHRDKTFGGSREYKTGDGYTGRCLFGEHRIADAKIVNIVESEKSAILATAMWGNNKGVWCATGGKSNIRLISDIQGKQVRLFPDIDARETWQQYGEVVEWWKTREFGDHDDVGDLVVKIISEKKLQKNLQV